jgi:predicted DCC family thiol-disulfide oxidoreductase YuxK
MGMGTTQTGPEGAPRGPGDASKVVPRPVLAYDDDCGFCTSSVRLLRRAFPGSYSVVAWQEADLEELGLRQEWCQEAVQWVGPLGERREGAAAFAAALENGDRAGGRALGKLLGLPFFSQLSAGLYALVAANRDRLPGGTPACRLPAGERPR